MPVDSHLFRRLTQLTRRLALIHTHDIKSIFHACQVYFTMGDRSNMLNSICKYLIRFFDLSFMLENQIRML